MQSKLTGKEILVIIEEYFEEEGNDGIAAYAWGDFDEDALGLGEVKEVDQYGGEGEGERWWSTKHFVDHDVYIKTRGYYSSYNGTDFDYGYGEEVKPVQKTITVFE